MNGRLLREDIHACTQSAAACESCGDPMGGLVFAAGRFVHRDPGECKRLTDHRERVAEAVREMTERWRG